MRDSEALQRQRAELAMAAQMAQHAQPPTREQLLQAWRANGGDEGDISFLESHPEMIDRHDVTVVAAEEAAQRGFERGTDAHREATREIFDRYLGHQQAQPAASAQPPTPASTPEFFRPPPEPPRSPAAPDRAALYSAPVSRGTPSGETGYRPARQVRLTAEEQEWARISGLSDVEYARHRQRLDFEKKTGQRQ